MLDNFISVRIAVAYIVLAAPAITVAAVLTAAVTIINPFESLKI
jgi:hypothetical protein